MEVTIWEMMDKGRGAVLPNEWRQELGEDVGVELPA